jgi:hypothetical protein
MDDIYEPETFRPKFPMTHTWAVKVKLPERFGSKCRVIGHPKHQPRKVIVEFEDGYQVMALSRHVKKIQPGQ